MALSKYPSKVVLPKSKEATPCILTFLSRHFSKIPKEVWQDRILNGKVLDEDENPISLTTPYVDSMPLYYFREVENEKKIPFKESILFENEDLLVCYKPHFLPVTPSGRFVEECLLNRLKDSIGISDLTPIHRIDRGTAGIVLFSKDKRNIDWYHDGFRKGTVHKSYLAIGKGPQILAEGEHLVENRIARGDPWFRNAIVEGEVNSRSSIKVIEQKGNHALFELKPITGKKHQLRLHMASLGWPIVNDRVYPELLDEEDDDFAKPLQLLAYKISFLDPISNSRLEFELNENLKLKL